MRPEPKTHLGASEVAPPVYGLLRKRAPVLSRGAALPSRHRLRFVWTGGRVTGDGPATACYKVPDISSCTRPHQSLCVRGNAGRLLSSVRDHGPETIGPASTHETRVATSQLVRKRELQPEHGKCCNEHHCRGYCYCRLPDSRTRLSLH